MCMGKPSEFELLKLALLNLGYEADDGLSMFFKLVGPDGVIAVFPSFYDSFNETIADLGRQTFIGLNKKVRAACQHDIQFLVEYKNREINNV